MVDGQCGGCDVMSPKFNHFASLLRVADAARDTRTLTSQPLVSALMQGHTGGFGLQALLLLDQCSAPDSVATYGNLSIAMDGCITPRGDPV